MSLEHMSEGSPACSDPDICCPMEYFANKTSINADIGAAIFLGRLCLISCNNFRYSKLSVSHDYLQFVPAPPFHEDNVDTAKPVWYKCGLTTHSRLELNYLSWNRRDGAGVSRLGLGTMG